MPSTAPTPSYIQSLIHQQQEQQQQQLQQQQQQQQHPLPQFSQPIHDQILFTQKLKQQLQQQQHRTFNPIITTTCSSSSSLQSTLSPTLTDVPSPNPRHLTIPGSGSSTNNGLNLDYAASGPSHSYYTRRTSATFRSSFSVPSLPSFEQLGFGPEDFFHQEDEAAAEEESQQRERSRREVRGPLYPSLGPQYPRATSHGVPDSDDDMVRDDDDDDEDDEEEEEEEQDKGDIGPSDHEQDLNLEQGHAHLEGSSLRDDDSWGPGQGHKEVESKWEMTEGGWPSLRMQAREAETQSGGGQEQGSTVVVKSIAVASSRLVASGARVVSTSTRQSSPLESSRARMRTRTRMVRKKTLSRSGQCQDPPDPRTRLSALSSHAPAVTGPGVAGARLGKLSVAWGGGTRAGGGGGDDDEDEDEEEEDDAGIPQERQREQRGGKRTRRDLPQRQSTGTIHNDTLLSLQEHPFARSDSATTAPQPLASASSGSVLVGSGAETGVGRVKSKTGVEAHLDQHQTGAVAPPAALSKETDSTMVVARTTPANNPIKDGCGHNQQHPHSHANHHVCSSNKVAGSGPHPGQYGPNLVCQDNEDQEGRSSAALDTLPLSLPFSFSSSSSSTSTSSNSPSLLPQSQSSLSTTPSTLATPTTTTTTTTTSTSSSSSLSMTTFAPTPTASHLQLLLQQHHALQRQEQEKKEQLVRQLEQEKKQKEDQQRQDPSLSLKTDAESVAAYMAAYLKVMAAAPTSQPDQAQESFRTIDPARTTLFLPTIAPSSTLLSSSASPASTPLTPITKAKTTKSSSAATDKDSIPKIQECHNCGVTKTPLWRRTHDRLHSLCNACGLYYKQYKMNRPLVIRLSKDGSADSAAPSPSSTLQQKQLPSSTSSSAFVSFPTDNAPLSASPSPSTPKRRKISETGTLTPAPIKNEPSEGGQQQQKDHQHHHRQRPSLSMKPLLPHPQPPTQSQSFAQMPRQSFRATPESESEDDDDDEQDRDYEDEYGARQEHHYQDGQDEEEEDDDDDDDEEEEDEDEEELSMRATTEDVDMTQADSRDSEEDKDNSRQPSLKSEERLEMDRPKEEGTSKAARASSPAGPTIECANCGQTQTPLWRKDSKGQSICNACGLYARLHQRDRPVTMRKTKIARRKRDWGAAQEKLASEREAASNQSKKRKDKGAEDDRVEQRPWMTIPVTTEEHESEESTLCLLEQSEGPIPTPPVSNSSMSPNMSASLSSMGLGGSLSPTLSASPPTPVLPPPNFMNTNTAFAGLNPLLLQQYQQQIQQSQALNGLHGMPHPDTTSSGPLPLLGQNWMSTAPLYPSYQAPFLTSNPMTQGSLALAAMQLQQQHLQQRQQQQDSQPGSNLAGPLSPGSNPAFQPSFLQQQQQLQQQQHPQQNPQQKQKHPQQQPRQQQQQQQQQPKKAQQGALILDSTRFTRLMNQMSKPQLSMFLTILEERCGALRHRLSGEDDEVERVDTDEMMRMMLDQPHPHSTMEDQQPFARAPSSSSSSTLSSSSMSSSKMNATASDPMVQDSTMSG